MDDLRLRLAHSLVLVSCVKSKAPNVQKARLLYVSPWFVKVREIIESAGANWLILSSLYGLVAPEDEIAPYDYTLNDLGRAERRRWASGVLTALLPQARKHGRVVMFAGERYREYLIEPLLASGVQVDVPMRNLRRGEQLAWLSFGA